MPSLSNPTLTGSLINPQTLMSIRNLELRARIVVQGFWNGIHRSPYHGFSVEFTEYRQYSAGDDPRYLDWRVFARSDRYFIKKFEDETNLRCHLLADNSRSMAFGSLGFGYFLYLQGDAIGLLTFDETIREYLPARHRSGHLRQIMLGLERPPGGQTTDFASPLKQMVEIIRKRGLMVILSDFFAPMDLLEPHLTSLAACGHDVVVFQLLDPAELSFNYDSSAMFEDMESGRTLFIDPGSARKDYERKLEAHCARLRAVCQRLGMTYHRLNTQRPLELALFDFLRERMQRRRKFQIRGRAAKGSHTGVASVT
jgi:uncharacterized protein (DUF58 family)